MVNLIILALLRQRPMHGYEIQQIIQTNRMDEWANLLSGSIYYALNKLEQKGLVRTEAEERTGARLRKIYAITETGEILFLELVRESLKMMPHSPKSDFVVGLNWIEMIPKDEALSLLQQNMKQVEDKLAQFHYGKEVKAAYSLSPFGEASFDNAIAQLELDLAFLRRVFNLLNQSSP
ncbi:PadR family transcriptional regulator [Paenibacillus dendritiformis]|uniref:PadR family transcriptional regulator n=1 Tax=Paenibacillus dendritiformis TaxID=130049 RepID=UPI00143CEE54|nr:PadR family transcriptional regulator [Paenibacillus dendritiformis]NKI21270.1 PadR family transcriptional regulator [Paenibacillus dendritiformis]NRG01383.1 PadR family transcriptional regulator [Paenibacillus dendritiformis]